MDIVTSIAPGQRYIVINNSITYNTVVYASGSEFVGLDGVTTYTGSGSACEIIEISAASIAAFVLEDPVYPERLLVQDSSLEITQNITDVIFPERLTLYSSGIEHGDYKRPVQPQIVYCRN